MQLATAGTPWSTQGECNQGYYRLSLVRIEIQIVSASIGETHSPAKDAVSAARGSEKLPAHSGASIRLYSGSAARQSGFHPACVGAVNRLVRFNARWWRDIPGYACRQRRSHGGILGILGSPREPHGPQEYGPRAIDEVIGRREACFREWQLT